MGSLLTVVTLVALVAAIVPYGGLADVLLTTVLVVLMFAGPVFLGTLALYCRGYRQTFFMGAFAGSLSTFYLSGMQLRYGSSLAALVTLSTLGAAATGTCACVALATRKMVERRGWNIPSSTDRTTPIDRS